MAGADLATVDQVIAKIIVGDGAILVAEQAIRDDPGGIELHLDFHVLRHVLQGGEQALVDVMIGLGGLLMTP